MSGVLLLDQGRKATLNRRTMLKHGGVPAIVGIGTVLIPTGIHRIALPFVIGSCLLAATALYYVHVSFPPILLSEGVNLE